MAQPIAPDYGQQFLFPPALEDWVPADHPARFIREFVDQLNLAKLGFAMPASDEGRPPYALSLLLKIWLYGYFHRIRSSRKLEVACREHLSLVWLTGMIAPDHNSLWRFWKENQKALRQIFKQTVQLAARTGAIGLALQALDGTRIQAACSGPKGWSKDYMEKLLAQLDGALEEIEETVLKENPECGDSEGYRLPESLSERRALQEEIKKGLAQLEQDGRKHYHRAEPEARRMKIGGTNPYAYNAQAVVDSQEGVIVAAEVVREENDAGQLVPMIEQARENVGAKAQGPLTVADSGYANGADLQGASERGMDVLAPPKEGALAPEEPYGTQHFQYDPVAHSITCPQGRRLDHEGQTTKYDQLVQHFRCHHRDCPVREHCTRDPKGRQIEVWPHTPVVQAMRARMRQPQAIAQFEKRSQIVERPFAQIKQHDGFRRWTVWGLEAVKTQWALLCATLNLRGLYRRWRSRFGAGGHEALGAAA